MKEVLEKAVDRGMRQSSSMAVCMFRLGGEGRGYWVTPICAQGSFLVVSGAQFAVLEIEPGSTRCFPCPVSLVSLTPGSIWEEEHMGGKRQGRL